ncbi:enoyl-CoA hydratase/isomerase family protein [Evansella sp. AB-rgal1]|uniref:enoyl-CoA hydratase/isomerase family protein n=1 Tax=Evansella sp. AB-rgal1 TaxID=3242696 RepID=UPI00359E898A
MEMIKVSDSGSIRCIELNNNETKNSLDLTMARELLETILEANSQQDCKVILFQSAGRAHFSKGPDIQQLIELKNRDDGEGQLDEVISLYNRFIMEIYQSPKITIAAIHGYAYGGGLNIMLACDYRLTVNNAKFIESFLSMGVTPDLSASYFLPKLIGMTKTIQLLFTGTMFTGIEAKEWGIFQESFSKRNEMMERARELADQFSVYPSDVIKHTKRLLRLSYHHSLEEQLNMERELVVEAFKQPTIENQLKNVHLKKLM